MVECSLYLCFHLFLPYKNKTAVSAWYGKNVKLKILFYKDKLTCWLVVFNVVFFLQGASSR